MALLETKGLTKNFGGLTAVSDVSFEVALQEIVGLIGPNGAGKTTLFNLLSGFYKPTRGEIVFDHKSVTNFPAHQICHLGVVRTFQIVQPFGDLTVLENAMVGAFLHTSNRTEAMQRAIEALEFVQFPTLFDKPASSLNLAQKKRLEMARALATQPQLLLLDEVMAGLNPNEIDKIIQVILRIRNEKKITIIAVEHVLKAIMNISDRIIVLDHGALIANGKPKEVTTNQAVIEAYLGRKHGAVKN